MRIKNMYMNFMKDYHFNRESKALAEDGKHIGEDEYFVWMKSYKKKHINKFCDIVDSQF